MVSKKILAVAIAAAFASQGAFAVVDITNASGAVVYAKEAITNVSAGFVDVASATNQLDINVEAGFGVVATNHVYVRFNLIGAKFKDAVVAGDLTGATLNSVDTVSVSQGGGIGQDYVIFDITAGSAGLDQADVLELALDTLKLSATASSASVYYTLFNLADASLAVAATGTTTTGSLADGHYSFASIANVLDADFTPDNAVADVATDFTEFVTDGTSTTIGTVEFALTNSSALLVDGTVVTTLDELIDDAASNVVLSGDLSFGAWDIDGLAIDEDTGALDASDLSDLGFGEFDVNVTVDGDTTINPGAYSLATDYTPLAGADFPVADESGDLGEITRNGTSIQVPFVTTNTASYNQKFVLVNRSAKAAPYSFTFTPEATVTAVAGALATGSIPAGKTIVIPATSVVTLTGGTRTAATITVTAQEANIDAATQMINQVTNGSDTINLIDHSQGTPF